MCCNDKGDLFRCASDTCASKWIMSQQIMYNNGSKHIWRNEHITGIVFRSLAPTAPRLHVELIMKWYKLPLITPVVVAALMKFDIQFRSEIYDLQFLSPLLQLNLLFWGIILPLLSFEASLKFIFQVAKTFTDEKKNSCIIYKIFVLVCTLSALQKWISAAANKFQKQKTFSKHS